MKVYHVSVIQDEDWFVGHVLEREGVTTQGRSLDELVFMGRDAMELLWNERDVHLEFIVPRSTTTAFERRHRKRRVTSKS